jgi:hypothetical protein
LGRPYRFGSGLHGTLRHALILLLKAAQPARYSKQQSLRALGKSVFCMTMASEAAIMSIYRGLNEPAAAAMIGT